MDGRQILKSTAKAGGIVFLSLLVIALVIEFLASRQLSNNYQELSAFCSGIHPGTTRQELATLIASKPGFNGTSTGSDETVMVTYHTCHCTVKLRSNRVIGTANGMCNG